MSTQMAIPAAMAWSMKTSSQGMPITTSRPGTATIGITGTMPITAHFSNRGMPVISTADGLTADVSLAHAMAVDMVAMVAAHTLIADM